jgi:hypothetical protein
MNIAIAVTLTSPSYNVTVTPLRSKRFKCPSSASILIRYHQRYCAWYLWAPQCSTYCVECIARSLITCLKRRSSHGCAFVLRPQYSQLLKLASMRAVRLSKTHSAFSWQYCSLHVLIFREHAAQSVLRCTPRSCPRRCCCCCFCFHAAVALWLLLAACMLPFLAAFVVTCWCTLRSLRLVF